MSAAWPPPQRPEPDLRKVAEAVDALRQLNRRLDAAERRMAELETTPGLGRSFLTGFARGFMLVLIFLLLLA